MTYMCKRESGEKNELKNNGYKLPNVVKDLNSPMQTVQKTPNRINVKKTTQDTSVRLMQIKRKRKS